MLTAIIDILAVIGAATLFAVLGLMVTFIIYDHRDGGDEDDED